MAEERVQRRLAAILAADVVGYSRLTENDEEGTIARLKQLRKELIEPIIDEHRGRMVKLMGDGALVEFASAVDAVRCAVETQKGVTEHNIALPAEQHIEFRIGINLGDIVIDGDDILGDGVNVAARLEGIAEPGGICISAKVHEEVRGKLDVGFDDLGPQQIKNIAQLVRTYRVTLDQIPAAPRKTPLPLPDKPSIAVLPFDNLSGDPAQEYFVDGIAEDIITGLSKFHWFFVIARNSSFSYKGTSPDVRQVAKELGVQYVLEGSVRKGGDRVRITAQLVDAPTGRHVWAERYDRNLDDIFAVQDEISEAITSTVAPAFMSAEALRTERKAPENFDAWDYAMRGNWYLARRGKIDLAEARRLFETALDLDPKSTMALSGLAYTLGFVIILGWADDGEETIKAAYSAARRAVDLDDGDAWAHSALGFINFFTQQLDNAIAECQRALELNPNFALAESVLSVAYSWRGDDEDALLHAEKATRLSPRDPHFLGRMAHARAEFGAGNYEQAAKWAKRTTEVSPEFPGGWRYLVSSLAHLGRLEEARAAKDQLLRVSPHDNIYAMRAVSRAAEPERMERFFEGLRKAGLPEA